MRENRGAADSHVTAYRPDVDGLRAIAVIAVIAFHLSKAALPGGYFGVDIFFVLSWFLITSIIWREIVLGEFTIRRFYDRRLRRIVPALWLVLAATTLVAALWLLPMDLVGYGKSLLATVGFVANVYFWRDTDYFARSAEEKPLLHIWSLGVEEQFYLLFPLLLVLIAIRARARPAPWIAALVLASVLLDVFMRRIGGALPAFYLLPTRAWELGVGALLPFMPAGSERARGVRVWLALVGAGLVALALARGPAAVPSALPDALPAVIGASLMVWSGAGSRNPVARVLAAPPLVFVGLISYSLYLWHWPVIVFLKYYLVRDPTWWETIAEVAFMAGCATVSWRFVERPFRSSSMPIARVRILALAGSVLAAAVAWAMIAGRGWPSRLDAAAASINAAAGTNYRCAVADYLYLAQSRACALELPSRDPGDADVILLGNSHAQMYAPVVRDLLHARSLHGLLVPANACLPTYRANITPACTELVDRNIDAVAALPHARVVVIGTTWDALAGPNAGLVRGLDATIDRLRAAGKRIVLIGPIPIPTWDVASVVSRSLAFHRPLAQPMFASQAQFEATYGAVMAHYEARPGLIFVRPDRDLCAEDRCPYVADQKSLYADDNHLAAAALDRFRARFDAALSQALGSR